MIGHTEFFAIMLAAFCGTVLAIPFWAWLEAKLDDFETWRARRAYEREQDRREREWEAIRDAEPHERFERTIDALDRQDAWTVPPPDHVTLRPRGRDR